MNLFQTVFSKSESHVSWGTGKDERFVGLSHFLKFVARDFEQSDSAQLKLLDAYTVVHENFSWVAVDLEVKISIKGVEHRLENLRGTVVLAKENGAWLIEHMHASWPCVNQEEGQSFPG